MPDPTPQEKARIQANVAKMRAAGAPDSDVLAYLQHEDSLAGAAPVPTATPGGPDTSLSLRNIGRSVTQGATFGFGDELGLTDRNADKAFAAEHPVANFFSRLAGGLVAPAAAVAAAPALGTTALGAAGLGAATGLLSGAGEAEGDLADRAKSGLLGGALGAAGGAASYGLAKGATGIISKIADRARPERAVARSAAQLIDPSVSGKLAEVEAIAPGGGSLATTAIPADGSNTSRLLPMLRGVGSNPKAAASAEANIARQQTALETARRSLGDKMDAVTGDIPINKDLRSVLGQVKDLIGRKAPSIGGNTDMPADANLLGLEKSEPFTFDTEAKTVGVQDLRDALSRLRFMERQVEKRGIDSQNGVTLHDIRSARSALQSIVYEHVPELAALDKPYAVVMRQLGHAEDALEAVQGSRAMHAANAAYGTTSGSLGGSLPSGREGVVMSLFDKILTNKVGAADAVARLIAKPGGPQLVDQILKTVPKPMDQGVTRVVAPTASAAIPAMRGLLFPAQP